MELRPAECYDQLTTERAATLLQVEELGFELAALHWLSALVVAQAHVDIAPDRKLKERIAFSFIRDRMACAFQDPQRCCALFNCQLQFHLTR